MEINFKKIVISEVLEKANKAKSKKDRIEILKQYNCMGLRDVLRGNFDDVIQWNLPEGSPPYEKMAPDGQWISLNVSGPQKLKYFVKGGIGKNMLVARREKMFIELLETSHPADAELIISMKDKKLQSIYKNITKKLVQDTWPQLISK
jgi:hypothetical protein